MRTFKDCCIGLFFLSAAVKIALFQPDSFLHRFQIRTENRVSSNPLVFDSKTGTIWTKTPRQTQEGRTEYVGWESDGFTH
jgi:hypothetical protein